MCVLRSNGELRVVRVIANRLVPQVVFRIVVIIRAASALSERREAAKEEGLGGVETGTIEQKKNLVKAWL